MSDTSTPSDPQQDHFSHSNVTGKVIKTPIRTHHGKVKGRVKRVRLSADKKSHFRQLRARGAISSRAAVNNGLQAKSK